MKAHGQRHLVGPRPPGRHDDSDVGPSQGHITSQVRPVHQSRHAYVGEKQLDVGICFEVLKRLGGISSLEYLVSRIQEHVGCSHALEHVVVDDQYQGIGWRIDHQGQRATVAIVPNLAVERGLCLTAHEYDHKAGARRTALGLAQIPSFRLATGTVVNSIQTQLGMGRINIIWRSMGNPTTLGPWTLAPDQTALYRA